jgi:ribosome-binding protein aMBF1 (putative translation factor)
MYHADPAYARQVAERRQRAGLSQHALGQLCDLTETVICRIETGRTPADTARRARIDAALCVVEQAHLSVVTGEMR